MVNVLAFSFHYDYVEDRILLVGNLDNGEERIDFWLTRKLVLRLLAAAKTLVEKTSGTIASLPQEHKAHMAQFHHDSAREVLQLRQASDPIVAKDANLLLRVDISYRDNSYLTNFFLEDDIPYATSALNYDELHQVLHLLHKGASVLDWGVGSSLFDSEHQIPQVLQ